ncbi:MAG: hypothetical protein IPP49_18115 [Saprospiraceae bacterium]|nr:hypothetical protein [Saprospiraceae bacterium]
MLNRCNLLDREKEKLAAYSVMNYPYGTTEVERYVRSGLPDARKEREQTMNLLEEVASLGI